MKLSQIDFFQLSLIQRINIEKQKRNKEKYLQPIDPYKIVDACSFLEQLRAYQLGDILGKYKLF
ncbi:MAG: hypothetical protein J7K80_02420 [Candidatus Izimaplasma sp.]|nr:hypothetical protein [Candidatus Izimaplasma bacterium]